jgi:diaminopimelate decarboxylase|tara:strand:- start:5407 stop:6666 length:1260 start_codon:yes stop_codon:yes gene_type:complete
MNYFENRDGDLHAENVSLSEIANTCGTPTFVYSKAAIVDAYTQFDAAFSGHEHRICYAVKANSNLAVLGLLAALGASFDIVSGGELQRVLRAGGRANRIVFSGVGKQAWELREALTAGISCFNVESEFELEQLQNIAQDMDKHAPISIRVNPDVDAGTHPYISTGLKENKFGVSTSAALALYARASKMSHISVVGIDCHIGSQITELAPFLEAMTKVIELVDCLEADGIALKHIDLGGGIGVRYKDEEPINLDAFAASVLRLLGHRKQTLLFEPGRYIVANAGVLLSTVIGTKNNEGKDFAIIDAAMNDLIRPALYQSWQKVELLKPSIGTRRSYDLVGPVCETGDFLAKDRELALTQGDQVAIHSSGAYGFVMSSNYNSRNRAAEIMVDGSDFHVVRARETIEDQLRLESLLPSGTSR